MTHDSPEHADASHVQSNTPAGGDAARSSTSGPHGPCDGDAPNEGTTLPTGSAHPPPESRATPGRSAANPRKLSGSHMSRIVVTPIAPETYPDYRRDPEHRFASLDPAGRMEALDAYGARLWTEAHRKRTGLTTRRRLAS